MVISSPTSQKPSESPWFLQGGGESGALARAVNWADTAVGPPQQWSSTLKTTVATLLRAAQPMFLWWGDELIQFYNDAYLPSFGKGKHPRAMGQRGRECWAEIWAIIGPQIDDVMQRGVGCRNEDALVPILRNGRLEEVYWTYTYSPVFNDHGGIEGTLVICMETTARVVAERRSNCLHDLVVGASGATTLADLAQQADHALKPARSELPFLIFGERSAEKSVFRVLASGPLSRAAAVDVWERFGQDLSLDGVEGVRGLEAAIDVCLPERPVQSVSEVFVGILCQELRQVVVIGIDPWLAADETYLRFIRQIAANLRVAAERIAESANRAAIEAERRSVLEQAPVAAALMIGPQHVFELANPRFATLVGKDELVGKSYREAFSESGQTQLADVLDRVYRTGESLASNEYLVPLDRGTGAVQACYFQFNLEPVRDAQGHVYGLILIAVDVTGQVASRRELERANTERQRLLEDLEQASRAKDEFLAMLGHELRNPLSPIMTALELMAAKQGADTDREQAIIRRQAQHLIRLVDDLLDVAKIARGKVELRRELVDLFDVISKAAETVGDLLERRHHELIIECERGSLMCFGDPVRLSQVIGNLLANAARYTDAGGRIWVTAVAEDKELVISVRDNGAGISSDMLSRVFNLFEQGARSTDRSRGGLGIGLALVKNLISLHGGSVSAHSEGLGRGSEFVVRLRRVTQSEPPPSLAPEHVAVTPCSTPRRILVVDDNVDALELLETLLTRAGHRVATATDGVAALAVAAKFLPEVAVLDIGLPVMDGYELSARIRELPQCTSCRVIALTGYGQQHDRARSQRAGFEHHLVKPIDSAKLLMAIEA